MRDNELQKIKNDILFDLDTIRIEQTSIDEPDKSYLILKLLNEIADNINKRFNEAK